MNSHTTSPDTSPPLNGIVKRRVKNLKGQRNRKSALHGDDFYNPDASHPLEDMNVQILCVSPEHLSPLMGEEEGGAIESRTGKVQDLVKQFDDAEAVPMALGLPPPRVGSASGEGQEEEGEGAGGRALDGASGGGVSGRRKLDMKALGVFEESELIMGMVSRIKMCTRR